jgi:hypothetical protein
VPVSHLVRWVLRWDTVNGFFFPDFYAHDLYMDKAQGVFLEMGTAEVSGNMPSLQFYRKQDGLQRLRLGWATARPSEITAGTTYTITMESRPTDTPVDLGAENLESYGVRILPNCEQFCIWVPLSWCSSAPGGNTIQLFNSSHPDGILALGEPFGGCNTLHFLYIPLLVR